MARHGSRVVTQPTGPFEEDPGTTRLNSFGRPSGTNVTGKFGSTHLDSEWPGRSDHSSQAANVILQGTRARDSRTLSGSSLPYDGVNMREGGGRSQMNRPSATTCGPHFLVFSDHFAQISAKSSPCDCASAEPLRRYPRVLDCAMAYSGMRHRN